MQQLGFIEKLYKKYYSDRDYEQLDLFRLVKEKYGVTKIVYPGSFIHVSPAFIFTDAVFIDSDKNAKKFFNDDKLSEFVTKRKEHDEIPRIIFHGIDYNKIIPKLVGQFDLMISQYAGFISKACKEYLKIGGILLVNNSHGDAGLASIGKDYKFIAVVNKTKGKYRILEASLWKYFILKKKIIVTEELIYNMGKGIGYTKTAPLYIFERIS